jgi:hypothetical protein
MTQPTPPDSDLLIAVQRLTGQRVPFEDSIVSIPQTHLFIDGGIGYSQFNEILLTLGYDRMTRDFFEYLFDLGNSSTFDHHAEIRNIDHLYDGVGKFQKHALLLYGNVKYAYKTLSKLGKNDLQGELCRVRRRNKEDFERRHEPFHNLTEIPGEQTYYLGYLIQKQLSEALQADPSNESLLEQQQEVMRIREIGRHNHDVYLTYDHMDVYVATSMRERHEYYLVNAFVKRLFSHSSVAPLRLRYFDPTQAYCEDRLDKGLVEGLMLKRAMCTIYHAQETDTLGKDSELATTLAQGKPVIAYVPKLEARNKDSFITGALSLGAQLYPGRSRHDHIVNLLRLYDPDSAWQNKQIRQCLSGEMPFDENKTADLIFQKAQAKYDSRASMLSKDHPLGLQLNLTTGVANGVLVVRTVNECAELLRRIILNEMEFTLEEAVTKGKRTLLLRETLSGCVFRAMTGDEVLTNSFWNFYLRQSTTCPHLGDETRPGIQQTNMELPFYDGPLP